jgi:hypothetical protein
MGGNKQPYEAFAHSQYPGIGTTPTKIIAGQQGTDEINITNLGTTVVYIGGPSVSPTNGFPVLAAGSYGSIVNFCTTNDVYACVASGTGSVATLITS